MHPVERLAYLLVHITPLMTSLRHRYQSTTFAFFHQVSPNFHPLQIAPKILSVHSVLVFAVPLPPYDFLHIRFRPLCLNVIHVINVCLCVMYTVEACMYVQVCLCACMYACKGEGKRNLLVQRLL